MGLLISLAGGCRRLDLRVLFILSLGGETRIDVVDEDDTGTADCDFGEGMAWDDKCKAGEDIVACRNDGVTKLEVSLNAAPSRSCILTFLLPPSFVFPMIG